ncbi:hypothetical protein BHE90_007027 [Fusarium euwallaceae]|uniref:Uncharacterized protein n=1 Tax=Fusarium euwallaceae TaxID=1147111 RepID=A0A430LS21_9HYPO|nr:hypothetical protein BHE90_007027 [Fusarium euwallaceae]
MDEKTSQAQVNLAKAAIHSYSTKRFIVSQWSIEIPQSSPIPDFSAVTLAELEAAIGIEYTIVTNGHFSDYYGYPKVKSYLKHAGFLVDIRNKTAAIPGSGNDKVVFTYSFDVARFVDALISTCKEWPKRSVIIGDVITMNDLVKVAEEARGEKFVVHYDDSAKLNTFQVTELPSHLDAYKIFPKPQLQMMFTVFGQWITRGLFDIPYAGSLNEMFPHIKTRSVKQLIDEAWK